MIRNVWRCCFMLFCPFCGKQHVNDNQDVNNASKQYKYHIHGFHLALVMLLLVWQPMSLQNTIQVHVIACW